MVMTASDLSNPVDKHPTSASFSPPPVDAILYLFYPFPVISPWILPLSIVLTLLYQSSVFLSKVLEVSKAITFIRTKIRFFSYPSCFVFQEKRNGLSEEKTAQYYVATTEVP